MKTFFFKHVFGRLSQGFSYALAILTFWGLARGLIKSGKTEAVNTARHEDRERDYEHAEAIRNRVDHDADQRLRRYDDAGYRD